MTCRSALIEQSNDPGAEGGCGSSDIDAEGSCDSSDTGFYGTCQVPDETRHRNTDNDESF